MGRRLWREVQTRVDGWRRLGCSEFLCRAIQFGIFEQPNTPFRKGEGIELSDIPQTEEDREFARKDLDAGCGEGIYREIPREHAMRAKEDGAVISSAFTVWQEGAAGRKGRFVVNLCVQSKHWSKGGIRMESLPEFACSIRRGDHFLSLDIVKGYRHFRLAPAMRDWFIFRYEDRYYQCVALPFGWGRSPLWFTRFMAIFAQELRKEGLRVLAYLDDILIAPSLPGAVATKKDCARARSTIEGILRRLGLRRHPEKGEWDGATKLTHLGVEIDSVLMRFRVAPHKLSKVKKLAGDLLRQARMGRRWVSGRAVAHFCGVCVSLSLAMPWARFYTRSLYWDMAAARQRDGRGRVKLCHQSMRDLVKWKSLAGADLDGRCLHPRTPGASIHSDAADMGYGGTLNFVDMEAGVDGEFHDQGVWSWKDRAESITYRELKAIRLLLMGRLGNRLALSREQNLLLHVDNQAVVHITNAFVSSSRAMMRELRRLKRVLDRHGLHIRTEWLPSVANKFADALSRRFPRGDLQIRRQLRRSVVDGMEAPIDSFPYRPLGEHPVFRRRQAWTELNSKWDRQTVRLLCPPVDLITPTLIKLRQTRAPAVLLIPHWPRQPWFRHAESMSSRMKVLNRAPDDVWAAQRALNPQWRLAMLDMNM